MVQRRRKKNSNSRRPLVSSTKRQKSVVNTLRRRTRSTQEPLSGGVVACTEDNVVLGKLSGPPQPNGFREGDYLHVSDLLGKCMRMIALSYKTKTILHGEPLWDNMLVTFAIGNGIHDYVREKVAKTSPDEMYGEWVCPCGNHKIKGTKTEADNSGFCGKCGHNASWYEEIRLYNEEYMIVGSVDLILLLERAFYLNEIKSIKKEDWDSITRPLPAHILQIVFYWWLANELGMPLYDKVSVLYVTKGHVFGSPYKEFTIDPKEQLYRLEPYLEDAKALLESRKGGELPAPICPELRSPMAKRCETSGLCFNMQVEV